MRERIIDMFTRSELTRMIQDYFGKTIGATRRVLLTYGPNGRSRGVAQITFGSPAAAAQAAKQLDGVKVDNRGMKVSTRMNLTQIERH